MAQLSGLAKATGMCFTDDDFLRSHPEIQTEIDFVKKELGSNRNNLELVTNAHLPLEKGQRVNPHVDDQNGIGRSTATQFLRP